MTKFTDNLKATWDNGDACPDGINLIFNDGNGKNYGFTVESDDDVCRLLDPAALFFQTEERPFDWEAPLDFLDDLGVTFVRV